MDIKDVISNLNLISDVIPNYVVARNKGLDDLEVRKEIGIALNLAIGAVEKQMPKTPTFENNGGCEYYEEWAECPDCGESIPDYVMENVTKCYCLGCGQKLNWED